MRMENMKDEDDEYEGEEKQREWGGWVLDAGKKVVMAGIVISSAPLLLPPFLVVSALGFAMSVPSGVVLASYACTRKLMTKLLPPPPPPFLQLPYYYEEEEEEDMKMIEDIKNEIEMRIELVEDEQEEEICYDDVQVGIERELEEEREMSSSSSSSEDEDIIDVEEIHVFTNDDVAEDEPNQLKEGKKEDSHGVNGGLYSHDEELISEEKIWEKIEAIRVIVGFKAPRRSSYLEEIKALYLFTGIEAPTSQDQSHLTFLMSVIGLK